MEFFFVGWVAYLIYIGTRSDEQRKAHLLLLWGSMIAITIGESIVRSLR